VNYRNTIEALDFSYHFLSAYLNGTESGSEIPLVHPEAGGRHGVRPFIQRFETLSGELNHIGEWLRSRAAAGVPYENMAVLFRFNNQITALQKSLLLHGIPVTQKLSETGKVCLMTMHASKGLEFNSVAIPDLGCMPCGKATPEEEAKLFYVAMTRATEQLLISYHRESVFTRQCEALG
jgi:superfamily I DNA/RNA helicase